MSISRKISLSLVSIALLTIALLSGLSFYGFVNIRATFTKENTAAIEHLREENVEVMSKNSASLAVSISNFIGQTLNVDFSRIMGELGTIAGDLEALHNKGGTEVSAEIRRHKEYIISQAASPTDEEVERTLKTFGVATSMFDNILNIEQYISLAYMVLENGIVISSTDTFYPEVEKADMRTRDWYTDTLEAGGLHWSGLYTGTDGRAYVTCSMPLRNAAGEIIGVVALDLRVSDISDRIFVTENNTYVAAFLMSREGQVLLSSLGVEETLQNDSIKRSVDQLNFDMVESEYYQGDDIIIGYSVVESTGWIMAAVLNYEQLMRPVEIVSESVVATGQVMEDVIQKTYSETVFRLIVIALVLLAITIIISYLSSKSIIRPIRVLTKGAAIIGRGDLDYHLPDLGTDEIGQLADSFTNMTTQLKVYIDQVTKSAADKQRLESELDLAKMIQIGLLPQVINCPGYDLAGLMRPAKEVGGDFYDYFMIDDTLYLVVADVSGKGVGAALFMTMAKVIIKTASMQGDMSVKDILEVANQMLCVDNPAELFVTAFIAMVDEKSGRIKYASAGHNPPVIIRKNKTDFLPVKPKLPLAAMEGTCYSEYESVLQPGDMLVLYTDGVTEATNSDLTLYGDVRLLSVCRDLYGKNSRDAIRHVEADVDAFVKDEPQFDDITIVSVLRNE